MFPTKGWTKATSGCLIELMKRKKRRVGICIYNWTCLDIEVGRGIASYLQGKEPWIFCISRPWTGGVAQALREWEGDGLICSLNFPDEIEFVQGLSIPVVNVAGTFENLGVPSVIGDDEAVGRMAAEHLIERGFRDVACISLRDAHYGVVRERAFTEAVKNAGGRVGKRIEAEGLHRFLWDDRLSSLLDWLKSMPKPVAVFAVSDLLAHMVIESCHFGGLRVPEDVAVLGVGNDPAYDLLSDPPISSVNQNFEQRGYLAAELLDRLMAGDPVEKTTIRVLPTRIKARRSTAVFAVQDESLKAALEFIAGQSGTSLRVDDVAAQVNLTRRTLERKFQQFLGRTVYDEIRRIRLDRAKGMLADTTRSLTDIAFACGFNSSSDFSKIFRKFEGISPGAYRQKMYRNPGLR